MRNNPSYRQNKIFIKGNEYNKTRNKSTKYFYYYKYAAFRKIS